MSRAKLEEIGYRWTKPSWEQAADQTMIFIVPASYMKRDIFEAGSTSDPYFDRTQRIYQIFNADGSWIDELHELQVERLLRVATWRRELDESQLDPSQKVPRRRAA